MDEFVPAFPWANVADVDDADIVFYTIPDDKGSDYEGAAGGPDLVLEVMHSINSDRDEDNRLVYRDVPPSGLSPHKIFDAGDVEVADLFSSVTHWTRTGKWLSAIGGDHSVTDPIVKALSNIHDMRLVVFDAHPDLLEGPDRFYGSWLRNVIDSQAVEAQDILLVGTRVWNPEHLEEVKDLGITIEDERCYEWVSKSKKPVYLSIDMDVFDPAYAPGVSDPHPFGLAPKDVLTAVKFIAGESVPSLGMDVVEIYPEFDASNPRTAHLAGWLALEAMTALRR